MTQLIRSSNINYSHSFVSRLVCSLISLLLLVIFATGALAVQIAAPKISFVTPLGAGSKTGASWADASGDLQTMVDAANEGDQVWVAGGVYNSPTDHPFSMKEGVQIYGGFAGTEAALGERDLTNTANISQLVGKNRGGGPPGNSVVLNIINISNTAILDGFVIRGSGAHGVQCNDSSPTLVNITITGNANGGMRLVNSSPTMINCAIVSNVVDRNFNFGGGITMEGSSSPTLDNCLIRNNYSTYGGGILSTSSGTPVLINCTITGNESREGGHAIFTNAAIKLLNCIVFNNVGRPDRPAVSGPSIIKHSLVQGTPADPENGNLPGNLNPLFTENHQLQPCSPAVNTGSNAYYESGQMPDISSITKDLSGNSRFSSDGKVDMGAFECQNVPAKSKPGVWYVKAGGTGSGVSWDCAFGDLQAAINGSSSGDQIWVAKGDYNSSTGNPFSMKEGVQIYGGFAGTETALVERDLTNTANISQLVGKNRGGGPPGNSVVLNIINISNTAVLDGFVIRGSGAHGVQCTDSSPKLVNITITGNANEGIRLANSSPTMINCAIVSNIVDRNFNFGGGITMEGSSSPTLVNCLIRNNYSTYGGGILSTSSGTPVLINCTITGNESREGGHAIFTNAAIKLLNCIVFNNVGRPDRPAVSGPSIIKHSLVQGTPADPENGNLPGNLNPLFTENYQLQPCSPAVNTGSNAYYESGQMPDISSINKDLAGNNRVFGNSVVDMGAYEYQGIVVVPVPGVWYVKPGGSGSGSSWNCPMGDLKLAINSASSGEQVWVAGGTFQPTDNGNFAMKEGVKIYGGFAGNETSLAARDPSVVANKSILQAYGHTVIYNYGAILTTAAVLDGFTISGSSNAPAILNYDGSPMLSNLIITENTAFGGMITFSTSPVLVNCSFTGNRGYSGGGLLISGGSPKLINCSFTGNSSIDGAGIFIDNASPVLVNCLIKDNAATGGGGGMCISNSTTSVTNCTIVGNTAAGQGGGILNRGTSPLFLRNSIVSGNNTGLANLDPPGIAVQYSLVQNDPIPGRPQPTNIDPLFVNPAGGDYRLQQCSPLVNAGFNYFNSGLTPDLSGVTTDLDNKARLREYIVDIGAYEFSGASRGLATDLDEASVIITRETVLTSFNSDCRLVAYINPTGVVNGASPVFGYISAKVWIASSQPTNFVKRHYEITPGNNAASATAKLTLFFTQQEFDDFNAVSATKLPLNAADAENYKANLLIEKRPGYSTDGTGLPNSYVGTIATFKPSDANGKVEWNEEEQYWEVTFDVTGFSGFFVKTTQTPLPLNLLSFTVTHETGSNLLQWSTTNEVNTDHFEVQSSRNAKNFIKIATVEAAGSGDFQYHYNDRTDYGGTVYYRLKMSDRDGTFTYSKIISLAGDENFANIYPNPAGALVTFQVSNALLNTTANLYDISGQRIQSIIITTNKQQINTKALTSGIYILKFADGTVERFVKE